MDNCRPLIDALAETLRGGVIQNYLHHTTKYDRPPNRMFQQPRTRLTAERSQRTNHQQQQGLEVQGLEGDRPTVTQQPTHHPKPGSSEPPNERGNQMMSTAPAVKQISDHLVSEGYAAKQSNDVASYAWGHAWHLASTTMQDVLRGEVISELRRLNAANLHGDDEARNEIMGRLNTVVAFCEKHGLNLGAYNA